MATQIEEPVSYKATDNSRHKKNYTTPNLKNYGEVKSLTAGGSDPNPENSQGNPLWRNRS